MTDKDVPLFFPCTCGHSWHGHHDAGNFPSSHCDTCNCIEYYPDHEADPQPAPSAAPPTEEEFVDRLVDISGPTLGSLIAVGLGILSNSARLTNAGVHAMVRNYEPPAEREPEPCNCPEGHIDIDPDCPQNSAIYRGRARAHVPKP